MKSKEPRRMRRALVCFLLLAGCAQSHALEIIAHRGASHDAPENTLAAARLGWEQAADAVEIDVYLSKDGQVVLHHDDTTKRTAGRDKKVAEQTLAELQQLDAGKWKGAQWAGEKIPTLDQVLATLPPGKRLFIEVKCGPEVIPPLAAAIARSGKPPEQLVIIGFSHPTMKLAKKEFPQIPVYWLSSFKQDKATGAWSPTVEELIQQAKAAQLDGLNLNFKGPLNAPFIRQVKAARLGMYVWTVNDPAVARQLVAAGVDGITTDRPGWLREQLKNPPPAPAE